MSLADAVLDEQWIQKRKPLWAALAELWLDTELSADDLERIARVMAESGLTIEQLRRVYLFEVAPVVYRNLLSMAGEWMLFDEEWLSERILHNLRNRPRRTRFWSWFPLTRRLMVYATERHWTKLVELVKGYRTDHRGHPTTQSGRTASREAN